MAHRLQITYTNGESHLEPTPGAGLLEQVIAEWRDSPDVAHVDLLRSRSETPRLKAGPVSVTLTDKERILAMSALASIAQDLHQLGHRDAEVAWRALQKVAQAEDVREMFGTRPPTLADHARRVAECEMQLALQRTASSGKGRI